MELKFYWNGSFAGSNHSMTVDGKEIRLCGIVSNEEDAKTEATNILKNDYGIELKEVDIKFEWGGRL